MFTCNLLPDPGHVESHICIDSRIHGSAVQTIRYESHLSVSVSFRIELDQRTTGITLSIIVLYYCIIIVVLYYYCNIVLVLYYRIAL